MLALDAARDDRLWDKRADAYVDAIKELRRGQLIRKDRTRILRYDEATEKRIADWLATYRMPDDWPEIEAHLYCFASQPVFDAQRHDRRGCPTPATSSTTRKSPQVTTSRPSNDTLQGSKTLSAGLVSHYADSIVGSAGGGLQA